MPCIKASVSTASGLKLRTRFRSSNTYRSLLTLSPSALARAWIDSSLRVIALEMARRLMPLPARTRGKTFPSEYKAG